MRTNMPTHASRRWIGIIIIVVVAWIIYIATTTTCIIPRRISFVMTPPNSDWRGSGLCAGYAFHAAAATAAGATQGVEGVDAGVGAAFETAVMLGTNGVGKLGVGMERRSKEMII